VAGATALLVAKLHKIGERAAAADIRPDRLLVKDGADVYRLMLHLDPVTTAERLTSLLAEPVASTAINKAVDYLRSLFRTPMSVGTRLAVAGLDGVVARDRVETVCITFTGGVLTELD
jgi:hypothetical protein